MRRSANGLEHRWLECSLFQEVRDAHPDAVSLLRELPLITQRTPSLSRGLKRKFYVPLLTFGRRRRGLQAFCPDKLSLSSMDRPTFRRKGVLGRLATL